MSWECTSSLRCECMKLGEDPQYHKWDFRGNLASDKERTGLYCDWAMIIHYYMERSLTRETDRLPALSGIVKELRT